MKMTIARKSALGACLVWLWAVGATTTHIWAQDLELQVTFQMEGYKVSKIGYPGNLAAGPDGNVYYVEWWEAGRAGRNHANWYLQCVTPDFQEKWFRSLTRPQDPAAEYLQTVALSKTVAVVATQADPSIKGAQRTMIKFFAYSGQEQGELQPLSNYKKKLSGMVDVIEREPTGQYLMWMGWNPDASASQQDHYVSVFDGQGKPFWNRQLELPGKKDGYVVAQAQVDRRGNVYFLMVPEKAKGTAADTLTPPVVVRFDPRNVKMDSHPLRWDGAQRVPFVRMAVTEDDQLVVCAMIDTSTTGQGLLNGQLYGSPQVWNWLGYTRFGLMENMARTAHSVHPLPDTLLKQYADGTAAFRSSRFVTQDRQHVYWLLEESYYNTEKKQHTRGDVLCTALGAESGALQWINPLPKTQVDPNSANMIGYAPPFLTDSLIHLVYLNKLGAGGAVVSSNFYRSDGTVYTTEMMSNVDSQYYFLPGRSCILDKRRMMLLGLGDPNGNNYKLIRVGF